ncbi:MAG: hypothetical protein IJ910_01225 [Bacteroidaceae bacterium]|nr:hypothetical protein [Bacteroidaceae bacterium]
MKNNTSDTLRVQHLVQHITCAFLHFLVDGLCLCCLYLLITPTSTTGLIGIFITYNVLAFLTQPLTGHWVDQMKHKQRMLYMSIFFLILAVLATSFTIATGSKGVSLASMTLIATLLGFGNSFFHVWGGKQVATTSANDMRALGLFVSTGAMGLAVSMVFYSWTLLYVYLLSICILSLFTMRDTPEVPGSPSTLFNKIHWKSTTTVTVVALVLLFAFVMFRSFIGEAFSSGITKNNSTILLLGGICMFGKMAGGWLAKYIGILRALLAILFVVFVCLMNLGVHWSVHVLGLFTINLTMPITLHLANRVLPGKEGLAFGILAAALMPGYLLSYSSSSLSISQSGWLTSVEAIMLWALLSTILIELLVLLQLGERRKKILLACVAINILTNVLLNHYLFFVNYTDTALLVGEVIAVLIEGLCYYFFTKNLVQSFIYSLLCNAISFLLGEFFQLIFTAAGA